MSLHRGIKLIKKDPLKEPPLDADDILVEFGAGCVWRDVYNFLDLVGVGVVGGERGQDVGVAGFTLGGGFSLVSNEYGLAIDNVVAYEVVLPDGTIKRNVVDSGDTQELFRALKVWIVFDDDRYLRLLRNSFHDLGRRK